MKLIRFLCLGFLLSLSIQLNAQDFHYTNYPFAPLYNNPANTGNYYGSYRFGLLFRGEESQFDDLDASKYLNAKAFMDSPLGRGLQKNHWVAAGLGFLIDRSGALGLQNIGLSGNLAYHIGFGPKQNQNISLGIGLGQLSRSTPNFIETKLPNFFETQQSKDLGLVNGFKGNTMDYSVGALYKRRLSQYSKFEIGAAARHINKGKIKFNNGLKDNPLPLIMHIQSSYGIDIGEAISLTPRVSIFTGAKSMNTQLQLMMDYRFFNVSDDKLKTKTPSTKLKSIQFGVGYRLQDAAQILLGFNYKDWLVGAAYDFTVSQAASYDSNQGGIEIGIQKIVIIPKKPKVKPKTFCPRF